MATNLSPPRDSRKTEDPGDILEILRRFAADLFVSGDCPREIFEEEAARGNGLARRVLEEGEDPR